MQVWQEVLKVALVGTERQSSAFTAEEDAVGRLLRQWDAEEKERTLLRASGLLTGYRRAGYRPGVATDALPPTAEPEERPAARHEVILDLLLMLAGEYREALNEWLQAVAEKRWRVPEAHLADLLDFGRGHPEFRDAILPVLGKRGRWLAAQNPDWKYALQISLFEIDNTPDADKEAVEASEAAWQTGTKEERVALLSRLRRSNTALTRTLIQSTWAQDAPDERAAFLGTFAIGQTMEDEPILEDALDDRRKEVRIVAQDLLLRLPESRLCQRMWERVRVLVTLPGVVQNEAKQEESGGLLGKVRSLMQPKADSKAVEKIRVTLPQECDKAMVRDGIEAKSPYSNMGEKTWWLKQMLERIPLVTWNREWNRSPGEILAANRTDDWKNLILQSWTAALRRTGDPEWATALYNHWIETQPDEMPADEVWQVNLPAAVFEAGVLQMLDIVGQKVNYGNTAYTLLSQVQQEWSVPLTQSVLSKLGAFSGNAYYIASSLAQYEPYIPAKFKEKFYEIWNRFAENAPYYQSQIQHYHALNEFRKEMRRKIDAAQEN